MLQSPRLYMRTILSKTIRWAIGNSINLRITKSSKTEGIDRQVNYYVFSLSGVSD